MSLTRRDFTTLLSGAASGTLAKAAGSQKPNFLVILADDLGFSDVGPYGGEIDTPNLNRLARGGVRFTQFYNCARCCPTRASLLTGLYPHQAGVGHMVNSRPVPSYQGYLNNRCSTMAEALKPAGYTTLMSGKWHVGENRPHWPVDRGFDHYYGLISGASNYFRLDPGRKMAIDNQPFVPNPDGFYMTDAFTENAVRLLKENTRRDNPFLLYLAYTSPHWPLHALPGEIDKYRGKYDIGWDALRAQRHQRQLTTGLVKQQWGISPRPADIPAWDSLSRESQAEWALRMTVYAAQVDRMDQGIGRVLRHLESTGQLSNTIVMFLADNGGCAEENIGGENRAVNPIPGGPDSFTSYRRPWANASNAPFRYYKHYVHEGGIASPLIVSWGAGLQRPGRTINEPCHLIDVLPTLLDAAGAHPPTERNGVALQPLEGRSLMPALRRRPLAPHPQLCWEHEGNRAIRQGDWKLVSRGGKPWELYDLSADRTELHDIALGNPDRVTQMGTAYSTWANRCAVIPWDELPKPT